MRSKSADFFLVPDQGRGQDRFQLGIRRQHLVNQPIKLLKHLGGLTGVFRGAEQGAGVDIADLLPTNVGSKSGRHMGVASRDVFRFGHAW